jgi:hypothetical protein
MFDDNKFDKSTLLEGLQNLFANSLLHRRKEEMECDDDDSQRRKGAKVCSLMKWFWKKKRT